MIAGSVSNCAVQIHDLSRRICIMGAMRALCIAILLCAAACAKKPAPKTPATEPTNVERKAAPDPAPGAPAPTSPAPPPGTSPAKVLGDPCGGGEKK